MSLASRREFFRDCHTIAVGGVATVVSAAVGLPALPKKATARFLYGLHFPQWRKINAGYPRPITLLDVAKLNGQYQKIKEKVSYETLNDILKDLPWKEETDDA